MRPLPRFALAALALAASAGPVRAQEAGEQAQRTPPNAVPEVLLAMPEMMGGMSGIPMLMMRPLAHIEGTLAFLRTEIGITEAQRPQWDAFADALRAAARDIQARASPAMGAPMTAAKMLPWPDRLTRTEKLLSARLDAVRALEGPVGALYGVLTAEQKRKADELMAYPMRMF